MTDKLIAWYIWYWRLRRHTSQRRMKIMIRHIRFMMRDEGGREGYIIRELCNELYSQAAEWHPNEHN